MTEVSNRSVNTSVSDKTIVIAGATGHLGLRTVTHLLALGCRVVALVRKQSAADKKNELTKQGAIVAEVNYNDTDQLTKACVGADCVVSTVSGVEDVIVHMQTRLLHAAINAGVPRFIPSDFCIDYTKLDYGTNRNLDLRRKFNETADRANIQCTSILNGMFTDLLTGEAPVVLFKFKRVLYWGNSNQLLDFTTMENTAEYTAHAALDDNAPRYLRIAGDVKSADGLKDAATAATGNSFQLFKAGTLGALQMMIKITRTLFPKKKEVFPPWQGMQYLHNMFTGKPKLEALDNDRYPGIQWTSVEEVLRNGTQR